MVTVLFCIVPVQQKTYHERRCVHFVYMQLSSRKYGLCREKKSRLTLLCEIILISIWRSYHSDFGMLHSSTPFSFSRTEGTAIEMPSSTFILPAQSLHTHSVIFIPLETGQLHIKGCIIKFSACKPREFSVLAEKSRREKEIWYDQRGGEIKVKQIGTGFPKTSVGKEGSTFHLNDVEQDNFWLESVVDATVLPPQPVLVLESSSSQDSCLMLLEGET